MMGPPPLPARVASLRPSSSSRVANQLPELPALPKPTVIDVAPQQASWMQRPPRTPNQDQNTPPSAQPTVLEEKENRPASSSSQTSSPLTYKRTVSSTGLPARPLSSSISNTTHNRRRTGSFSPLSTLPTSELYQDRTLSGEASSTNDDLAAYAMQSEEGRRAALNEMIFQCLADDNFITLLEDMETCVSKQGFGMR
jgi:hypothetical protein